MDIDEFMAHIDTVQAQYPMEAEKALRRGANAMRKELKAASPDGKNPKAKRKIKDSWKVSMSGTNTKNLQANIRSASPHFHLVERGHVKKTKTGKVVGYQQGTHFMEKTVNAKADEIQDEMGEYLFDILQDKL